MSAKRSFESYQEFPEIPPEKHLKLWVGFYYEVDDGRINLRNDEAVESMRDAVSSSSGVPASSEQIRQLVIERRMGALVQAEMAKLRPEATSEETPPTVIPSPTENPEK